MHTTIVCTAAYRISLVKRRGYYKSRDRYDAASIRGRRLLEGGVYPFSSALRRVVKMADGRCVRVHNRLCHKRVPCVQSNVNTFDWCLLQCEQERGNVEDMFAVAVKRFSSPFGSFHSRTRFSSTPNFLPASRLEVFELYFITFNLKATSKLLFRDDPHTHNL